MATGNGGQQDPRKKTAVNRNDGRPSFSPAEKTPSAEDRARQNARIAEKAAREPKTEPTAGTRPVVKARKRARARKTFARFYVCGAVVLIALAVLMAVTVFFTVEVIEVNGNVRYSAAEIIEKTGIEFGDNLLLMDKFDAVDSIRESLLFVSDVEIRRSFPNKLVINVTEVKLAVAFDCGEDGYWLADTSGRLLERTDKPPAYSAQISGITLQNPLLGGIFTAVESEKQQPLELLLAELAETGCIEGASNIRIEKIYDIRMTYKDRYEIVFGRSDQIESALAKLDLVIAELEREGIYSGEIDFSDGGVRVIG